MLTKCKICVAKTAGFCFGVDRAVKIVYNELDNRNNVVTLGPIIHNPNVVSDLEAKGVYSTDVDKVTKDQTVVIRSHGVGLDVYEKLAKVGAEVIDATCPFVARIHKIAAEKSGEGYVILIAGDEAHPEIMGIRGHCSGESYVFSSCDDFENLVKEKDFSSKRLQFWLRQRIIRICGESAKSFLRGICLRLWCITPYAVPLLKDRRRRRSLRRLPT